MSRYDDMPLTEFLNACTMSIILRKEALKAVEDGARSKNSESAKISMMMQILERIL